MSFNNRSRLTAAGVISGETSEFLYAIVTFDGCSAGDEVTFVDEDGQVFRVVAESGDSQQHVSPPKDILFAGKLEMTVSVSGNVDVTVWYR